MTDIGNGLTTIQQMSNGWYLDAYQGSGDDFRVVNPHRRDVHNPGGK